MKFAGFKNRKSIFAPRESAHIRTNFFFEKNKEIFLKYIWKKNKKNNNFGLKIYIR